MVSWAVLCHLNMYFFDVNKAQETYPKWNKWRLSLVPVLVQVTFYGETSFMSGQVGHQIRSENLFFLELLISKLWTMGCGFVFSAHRSGSCGWDSFSDFCVPCGSSKEEKEFEPRSCSSENLHLIAVVCLCKVLQDAEGRINSFLQCHALVALRC